MTARTLLVFCCVAAIRWQVAPGQDPGHPFDPESLSFAEENALASEWRLERLGEMLEHPLDLNTAPASDLLLVPGFDRTLVIRILESRTARPFRSVDEILEMPGTHKQLLAQALPFITVPAAKHVESPVRFSGSLRSKAEAFLRVIPDDGDFLLGSRWKILSRLLLEGTGGQKGARTVDMSAGVLIEKDAGETRLADHTSGFLRLHPGGSGVELVLGDFAVGGALGLAFGSRGGRMKSADVLGVSRWRSLSLRPRASSSETGTLRGIAIGYRNGACEAAAFYSNRAVHARLDESSVVTSLYEAGLFTTPGQEAMRFRTRERVMGIRAAFRLDDAVRLGISALESKFVHPLNVSSLGKEPARRFAVCAADVFLDVGRLGIAAEVSRDGGGVRGLNVAIDARISRSLDALVFVRSVAPGFVSLHGYPMSDRAGSPGGESGVYLGLRWKILPPLTVKLFTDQFRTEGDGAGGFASTSADLMGHAEASLARGLKLQLQARERTIRGELDGVDAFGRTIATGNERSTRSVRFSLTYEPVVALRLKSTVELRIVRPGTAKGEDRGFAMAHDATWRPTSWLLLNLRAASFETDSYASRLYSWERGVRGSIVQTLFSGAGFRWSSFVRITVGAPVVAEVKYSETDRNERDEGDARPVLLKAERRHISAQLEIRF